MVKPSQALTKPWSNIIIWMLFVIPSCVLSVDDRHKHCTPSFKCGNQKDLYYPFWTPAREECGHPGFEVNCSGGFAEFSISSVKFRILEMNRESNIIRLARIDYLNNLCPQSPKNATIDQKLFSFHEDTEVQTFYYNCSGPRVDFLPSGYITQLDCDDNSYFVKSTTPSRNGAIVDGLSGSCETNVNIPVSRSAFKTTDKHHSPQAVKKALAKGFQLKLSSDCSRCKRSGGACGYSPRSKRFLCYCQKEPRGDTCPNKVLSKEAKIGLGFAGGFLGATFLAGGVLCFIIRRRKKMGSPYTRTPSYASNTVPKTTPFASNTEPTTTPYASTTVSTNPSSTTMSKSNHSLVPSISNLTNESVYFGVQVFSYDELEEATENFSKELGDGGFGTVYYGLLKDGRAVAVKRLYERSLRRVEQFMNEIEILKSLKHPNLVILYGCTTRRSRELLLVYEYISNGTLADHLHGNQPGSRPLGWSRPLCWPTRLNIAIETASALSFLHTSGIIHRDVKSTNILLDNNYQVKVADFGLSRLFRTDQTHISTAPQGTPGYVDPQYYQCYQITEKSDVYSFGVVLSELISSKEAVDITRHLQDINLANMAISRIQNDALHELADLSLGFATDPSVKRMMMSVAELAFRCLQQERDVRPSMDEIVEVLRGIQKEGIRELPEVDEIDMSGGDDVRLRKHAVPPPLSQVTDKESTSCSNTPASSF